MVAGPRWIILIWALATGVAPAQTPSPQLFVVHFEVGSAWDEALPAAEQPGFREHSANLKRLREEGFIPFGARYGEFGMIFLRADSLENAEAIIEADPGVTAGTFTFRIAPLNVFYPWQP